MGWKTFKQKFNIEHIVQITDRGVCIGSAYCHDLAIVDPKTGSMLNRHHSIFSDFLKENYPNLYRTERFDILASLQAEDTFETSIPVFTYNKDQILELKCEKLGWPNITHCGKLMYDNLYFKTKEEAVKAAIKDLKSAINYASDHLKDFESRVASLKDQIKADQTALERLSNDS